MAHVAIGRILGTTQWRVKRDTTFHNCDNEETARACAAMLATGGLQIVETSFHEPSAPGLPANVVELVDKVLSGELPAPSTPGLTSLSITKLRTALATGEYDGVLSALEAAERASGSRVGAIRAIAARAEDADQG